MRHLNNREIKLLLLCLFAIFSVVNMFGIRAIYKNLKGGSGRAGELKLELLEQQVGLVKKTIGSKRISGL